MSSSVDQSLKDKTHNLIINARWVLKYSWETCPGMLMGLILSKSLASAMPAALAWVGRGLINAIVDASKQRINHLDPILPWLILCLGLVLAGEIISVISKFFHQRLEENLSFKIDMDKIQHIANLDVSWFEDPNFQDTAERAQHNTSAHFTGFLRKIIELATNILKVAGLVLILIAIDPIIVLAIIPIVFPYIGFKWQQSKARFKKEYSRAVKRRWSRYFTSVLTTKVSVAEVKLLKLAPLLIDRYRTLAIEFLKEDRKIHTREFIGVFVFSAIFSVVFYIIFGRIAHGVLKGDLTIGDITMFAGAAGALRGLLDSLANHISGAVEDTLYIDNLIELFKTEPKIDKTAGTTCRYSRGKIEVRNVYFTYPGSKQTILKDVSLQIEPGETVALVGKNGAGKTTLAKLLARLYDPEKGKIFFDGTDIREISLDSFYEQVSFVFQLVNRYEATATENILYGHWEKIKTRKQVEEIARLANVNDMIEAMPEGYNTMLGRKFGEYDLSGGQWKKIAIARAFARKDSSLVILDEATAGLDAQAEYDLFSHFKELASGRTTILISHRFSSIKLANRIIVLDQGRIVESGTHEELIDRGGHYASLYNLYMHQTELKTQPI